MTLPPFQALLDRHAADLHRFLVASVGPHDGADCFQDVVVAALRAYPGLAHADNLRGWLFTIAHRKVVDHARRRGRHALPVAELPEPPGGPVAVEALRRVDDRADGELVAAVRALPPKQRTAVVQRYLLDRSYGDVAAVLGCSEDAARQNVRAGLQRLRRLLTVEVVP
ncbi:MAG TPA: RNA polymerase sigma factor [Acidimicrobiales bacterium]|nr:RNA polymerase sigma factor [Acidimicrobiales bacterium]